MKFSEKLKGGHYHIIPWYIFLSLQMSALIEILPKSRYSSFYVSCFLIGAMLKGRVTFKKGIARDGWQSIGKARLHCTEPIAKIRNIL